MKTDPLTAAEVATDHPKQFIVEAAAAATDACWLRELYKLIK